MYQFSFEKLDVWNEARKLTRELYDKTKMFPDSERFGLVNQIRRAAVSVCSNIAEGSSHRYLKEQIMFYQIAYSSLMEVMNQAIISADLDYMEEDSLKDLRGRILKISGMLNGLRNSQQQKEN